MSLYHHLLFAFLFRHSGQIRLISLCGLSLSHFLSCLAANQHVMFDFLALTLSQPISAPVDSLRARFEFCRLLRSEAFLSRDETI